MTPTNPTPPVVGKERTAMQQALDIIEQAREGEIDDDLRSIRHRIEKLLELERKHIVEAYDDGFTEADIPANHPTANDYFQSKYQQP